MFSANQNIALREHKRRVVAFVESTIPEAALDMGTIVMAMEVSCKAPGCVPLETVITIVFPRGQKSELIPGLPESGSGGNYKTKILMPLAEVTQDDVLDALPPEFEGGRRTMESLCLRARDVMIGQIGQIMGDDDLDGRKLMAEYLVTCLKDYVDRDCVAPEVGESFAPLPKSNGTTGTRSNSSVFSPEVATATTTTSSTLQRGVSKSGNFVVRRASDDKDNGSAAAVQTTDAATDVQILASSKEESSAAKEESPNTSDSSNNHSAGNFVVHRTGENGGDAAPANNAPTATSTTSGTATPNQQQQQQQQHHREDSAMDWRRRNKMEAEMNAFQASASSQSIIKKLSEREHAAGVRRPGCPCCDPDNPSNVVDNMMML